MLVFMFIDRLIMIKFDDSFSKNGHDCLCEVIVFFLLLSCSKTTVYAHLLLFYLNIYFLIGLSKESVYLFGIMN